MVVEGIVFAVKGIILTECLTRAARTWELFDGIRSHAKKLDFFRRLLDCFECTSVWVGAFVVAYLVYFELEFITWALLFATLARYLHTFYEYLDACRSVKEGEL